MPGQKLHSSIAFCPETYHPKAILPQSRRWDGLVAKGPSDLNWADGWEEVLEMDIFDYSQMHDVIEKLKSGTGSDESMWTYRLTVMTSTGEFFCAVASTALK